MDKKGKQIPFSELLSFIVPGGDARAESANRYPPGYTITHQYDSWGRLTSSRIHETDGDCPHMTIDKDGTVTLRDAKGDVVWFATPDF